MERHPAYSGQGAHRLRVIVIEGTGAAITTAAVFWMLREKVELLMSSADDAAGADSVALFAPLAKTNSSRAALKLRLRQFEAVLDPGATVRIAREIVAAKIKAEAHPPATERTFLTALTAARSTDDIRHIEAGTAQVWWRQWQGAKMRFVGPDVPAEWPLWQGRADRGG